MKTAAEMLKYKCNSMNHLLEFPVKSSLQLRGGYIHVSAAIELMEEYATQSKWISVEDEKKLNEILIDFLLDGS